MLQRIQTLWMFLAALCAALTFKFPFSSGNVVVGANGHVFQGVTASNTILLLLVTVILIAGILINIFLYKTRRRQILILTGLIVLSLLNIFLFYQESNKFIEGHIALTALPVLIIPVLLILAIRGVIRDNRLVKSADRLR